MTRILFAALALALAGCAAAPPEESGETPGPCGQTYVSMQFAGAPEDDALLDALDAAGYRWSPAGSGILDVWPSGSEAVDGTISRTPGPSGDDLVVSVQERLQGDHEESVRVVANDLAQQVNETYPDARMTRWVEGVHTAGCGVGVV